MGHSVRAAHRALYLLRSSKARLFFRSAKRVSLIDSEFGPSDDISQIGHTEECQFAPEHILLDRVYMHDYKNPSSTWNA